MIAQSRHAWVMSAVVCLVVLLGWDLANRRAPSPRTVPLRPDLSPEDKLSVHLEAITLAQAGLMYADLTGRTLLPRTNGVLQQIDDLSGKRLSRWHLLKRPTAARSGIEYHRDGRFSALEVKESLESLFRAQGLMPVAEGRKYLRIVSARSAPPWSKPLSTR